MNSGDGVKDTSLKAKDRGFYPPNLETKSGAMSPTFKFLQVNDSHHIQRGPKMACIFFVGLNFVKYCPIFELISLLESEQN